MQSTYLLLNIAIPFAHTVPHLPPVDLFLPCRGGHVMAIGAVCGGAMVVFVPYTFDASARG